MISRYMDSEREKIMSPIYVMEGKKDEFDVKRWKMYTDANVYFKEFSGGQFFIEEHKEEIVYIIEKMIMQNLDAEEAISRGNQSHSTFVYI